MRHKTFGVCRLARLSVSDNPGTSRGTAVSCRCGAGRKCLTSPVRFVMLMYLRQGYWRPLLIAPARTAEIIYAAEFTFPLGVAHAVKTRPHQDQHQCGYRHRRQQY
jgi:hypothetical protein